MKCKVGSAQSTLFYIPDFPAFLPTTDHVIETMKKETADV